MHPILTAYVVATGFVLWGGGGGGGGGGRFARRAMKQKSTCCEKENENVAVSPRKNGR